MSNQLIYVVISTDTQTGEITDTELLDGEPTWGPQEIPVGTTQTVCAGYLNGGDTSAVWSIVGTGNHI